MRYHGAHGKPRSCRPDARRADRRRAGFGGPGDPVAAYWLYDRAAALGVPHARQNQITIYERRLTPEQRQQVLVAGNKN